MSKHYKVDISWKCNKFFLKYIHPLTIDPENDIVNDSIWSAVKTNWSWSAKMCKIIPVLSVDFLPSFQVNYDLEKKDLNISVVEYKVIVTVNALKNFNENLKVRLQKEIACKIDITVLYLIDDLK